MSSDYLLVSQKEKKLRENLVWKANLPETECNRENTAVLREEKSAKGREELRRRLRVAFGNQKSVSERLQSSACCIPPPSHWLTPSFSLSLVPLEIIVYFDSQTLPLSRDLTLQIYSTYFYQPQNAPRQGKQGSESLGFNLLPHHPHRPLFLCLTVTLYLCWCVVRQHFSWIWSDDKYFLQSCIWVIAPDPSTPSTCGWAATNFKLGLTHKKKCPLLKGSSIIFWSFL